MDEEEERKKFEMEENGEKEGKKRLDKEALCERLKTFIINLNLNLEMTKISFLNIKLSDEMILKHRS